MRLQMILKQRQPVMLGANRPKNGCQQQQSEIVLRIHIRRIAREKMRAKSQKRCGRKRHQWNEKYQQRKDELRAFELTVNHSGRPPAWDSAILSARNSPRSAVKCDSSKRSTLCLIQKDEYCDSIFSNDSSASRRDSVVCS